MHSRIRDKLQLGSNRWLRQSINNNIGRASDVLYVQVELS